MNDRSPRPGGRLGSRVYDLLRERIVEGGYSAGERVAVEALKAEFGVSKQPVMDAVRRLSSDGLLEIIPQVGCMIPVYAHHELVDFYTVFAGTEGAIAAIAAERWTGTQVGELAAVNAGICTLADDPDARRRSHGYRVMNRTFHGLIHDLAGSRLIADMSRRMWDLSDMLINTGGAELPLAGSIRERCQDHDTIVEALERRDSAAAREAMQSHISATVPIIEADLHLVEPQGHEIVLDDVTQH